MGTGTTEIVKRCEAIGLRKPEFSQDPNFTTILWRKEKKPDEVSANKVGDNVGDNVGDKTLNENRKKILEALRKDCFVTKPQLEKIVELSKTAIDKNITYLKENGYIRRVGANKNGHWEVLGKEELAQ